MKAYPIVEFYGLLGVGKSTLARALVEGLSEKGIDYDNRVARISNRSRVQRILMKSIYVIKEIACHPVAALHTLITIGKTKQNQAIDLVKVTFNFYFTTNLLRWAKKHPSEPILLDQGLFQAIWSINDTGRRAVDIDKLLRRMPLPDLVITVKAGEGVINRRLYHQAMEEREPVRMVNRRCFEEFRRIEAFILGSGLWALNLNNVDSDDISETIRDIIERIEMDSGKSRMV